MQQLKSILNALISLILHFWLLLEKAVYHKLHKSVMQPSSCGGAYHSFGSALADKFELLD